jgi:hypothetical protein
MLAPCHQQKTHYWWPLKQVKNRQQGIKLVLRHSLFFNTQTPLPFMKSLLFTGFLLAAFPVYVIAQTPDSVKTQPARVMSDVQPTVTRTTGLESGVLGLMQGNSTNTFVNVIDNRYEGLRGTPYFLPNWLPGDVELNGGVKYRNQRLKFNAATQNLLVKEPRTGDSVIVDAQQIRHFLLYQAVVTDTSKHQNAWFFKRYTDLKTNEKDLGNGYFLVLYDGKTTLLKQVRKIFKKADYKDPYSTNVRYDTYDEEGIYYILRPDRELVRIKRNKKALIEVLTDQKEALTAFADQQKLTGKNDEDLVKLVAFYDKL